MKKLKNKDLQRISIEEFKSSRKTPITLVLDNVRSALNVGAIFRTADAFLIKPDNVTASKEPLLRLAYDTQTKSPQLRFSIALD